MNLTAFWSCIFFSLLSLFGWTQNLSLANRLYEEQNYLAAKNEYLKVQFLTPDSFTSTEYLNFATCYLNTNDNSDKAFQMFDLAYNFAKKTSKNDSIANEILYQKSSQYIQQGYYDFALIELFTVYNYSEYFTTKTNVYKSVIYLLKNNLEKSEKYALLAIDSVQYGQQIHELYARVQVMQKRFKPNKIMVLSAILPGLGQALLGEWKESINSFIIVGGLLTLYTTTVSSISILDAVLVYLPWFTRYHKGGYLKAKKLAETRILNERNKAVNTLIDLGVQQIELTQNLKK